MSARILPLLLAATFALSACATHSNPDAAMDTPPTGVRVVVAPMNLSVRAPGEVADRDDRVWREILAYFAARGNEVAVLSPDSADRLWRTVTEDLDIEHRGRALMVAQSRFAAELARYDEFDLVVLPSLILRASRMHGDYATWDGVRRRVPNNSAMMSRDLGGDVVAAGGMLRSNGLSGQVAGASLHVSVLRADGSAAFQGIGGLEVVQEVQREDGIDGDWTFATREDPFSKPGNLREGVARAFENQLLATAEGR